MSDLDRLDEIEQGLREVLAPFNPALPTQPRDPERPQGSERRPGLSAHQEIILQYLAEERPYTSAFWRACLRGGSGREIRIDRMLRLPTKTGEIVTVSSTPVSITRAYRMTIIDDTEEEAAP